MKRYLLIFALFCLPAFAQSSNCTLNSGALSCDPPLPDAPYTASFSVTPQLCGPPKYPCSRSDLKVSQTPNPPPAMGAANSIMKDPDFGNRILRATDGNTVAGAAFFNSTASGGGGDRMVNLDSSLFAVKYNGAVWFLDFDAKNFRMPHPIVTAHAIGFGLQSSKKVNNVFFLNRSSKLLALTFPLVNGVVSSASYTQTVLYDFASCPGMPQPFTPLTGSTLRGDDDHLIASFGTVTGQDNKTIVAAWYRGQGCSWLNTASGEVKGDFGSNGKIPGYTPATVHDTAASQDGKYASVSWKGSGTSAWEVGTLNLQPCVNRCDGHEAQGYTQWVNSSNPAVVYRLWGALPVPVQFFKFPSILGERHFSWNNNLGNDQEYLLGSTAALNQVWTAAFGNEIWGLGHDGSWRRFAHTFSSGKAANFWSQNAITTVSPDGRFAFFSTDWLGATGRSDVYIVELQ